MKKKISVFLIACFLASFTGCWDNVEIDRRCFVSTIGIDVGDDIDKAEKAKDIPADEPFAAREIKKLKVVLGYPDMSQLGPGKGGTAESKSLESKGSSMQDALLLASLKSSRKINLGHSKLLLISSEMLKYRETIKEIMDFFQRDPYLNRMMQVVVVDGCTKNYISLKPEMENNIEYYISGLMEHTQRSASVTPMTVNEMLKNLTESGNVLIPRIKLDKKTNEIILKGVAIVKDYGLEGYLSSLETADLSIIRGIVQGGNRLIYVKGRPLDFTIQGEKREINVLNKNDDKLKIQLNVSLEGQIKGYYTDEKVSTTLDLTEVEKDISKAMSEECTKVAKMIQEEFGIEPFGIQEHLRKFHPTLWKEIMDHWEKVYKSSDIEIIVDTKIRRIGITE